MNTDDVIAKLDMICCRMEDLLAEMIRAAEKRPGPYAKVRETYPNTGKPWSKADDEELARLHAAGNSVHDLALLFGRTPNGVRLRLEHLAATLSQAA